MRLPKTPPSSLVVLEAARELRASRVATLLSALVVAGVILGVNFTYGRSIAAAQDAVEIIDSVGTRTITVRLNPELDLPLSRLEPIADLSTIDEIAFLGPTRDVHNAAVEASEAPLRDCYAVSRATACDAPPPVEGGVLASGQASPSTLRQLGFSAASGAVVDSSGTSYAVQSADSPMLEADGALENTIVATAETDPAASVAMVVIVVDFADAVDPVVNVVEDLLVGVEPTKVEIIDARELIAVRNDIDRTLLDSGRLQTLGVLGVAGLMLGLSEFSMARSRRRYAGLRRALGATRRQIVVLAVTASAIAGAIGVAAGIVIAAVVALVAGTESPPFTFQIALAVVVELTVISASAFPAAYSATRDPATELRVP